MNHITLNNGVEMPLVGLGTYLLSPDEAQASATFALDNGYELIDTANVYVNERGVGRGMRASTKAREDVFLETKLWPSFYDSDTAVDETLERLGVAYIDLMILHQPAGDYITGYRKLE
ncbi:MAG: aldo/keto reductase, partial [Schaalia georgiae]|nr:aldo/keto reductase [Schaalia georgiae]